MKLTIKDIAARCNVGKSTVSRVLNNDPNVKAQTREKIQQMIDELGFQPCRNARAMRGASSPIVGVIVTRLHSTAESQTLSEILRCLYAKQITPIIVESQFQPENLQRHFQLFREHQVSGVILFGFSRLPESILAQWQGALVTIARSYPHFSSVCYDDHNAIQTLMHTLHSKGHRHIGYLGVNEQDETTGRQRTQSYLQFCRDNQLTPYVASAELNGESGYQAMKQFENAPITALLCASSTLAIGALKFLQENKQKLPLACIGKNPLLDFFAPELLSLEFGYSKAGKLAVDLLLSQLNAPQSSAYSPEHRQVPFHF